jgi:hypothetical protein
LDTYSYTLGNSGFSPFLGSNGGGLACAVKQQRSVHKPGYRTTLSRW